MTETVLDELRKRAEHIYDEAGRLRRALKGSSSVEATVREHLGNVTAAAEASWKVLNPPVEAVSVPFVQPVEPEPQPEPPVAVQVEPRKGRKK